MDDRYPKYIRFLVRKLDFMAIPNWNVLICGLAVLAFVAQVAMQMPIDRFIFDPYRVVHFGEYFRLFAFPGEVQSPIFFFFYVMYVYFVIGSLEEEWGSGPMTIFILMSYFFAMGAGFLFMVPLSIWFYVLANATMAFGTVFPNHEFMLFLIIPAKAKFLAYLTAGLLLLQAIGSSWSVRFSLFFCVLPYLLFFGPMFVRNLKQARRARNYRKQLDDDNWR